METVEIRFDFLGEEIEYLGLAANYLNLLWGDFIRLAVEEKIEWALDPANKEEVEQEKKHPELELTMQDYENPLEPPSTLSFNFPKEKLLLLEESTNKLGLKRDQFLGAAVICKIGETEDMAYLEKRKLESNVRAEDRGENQRENRKVPEKVSGKDLGKNQITSKKPSAARI